MAVIRVSNAHIFTGLKTDTKPVHDIPTASIFHEWDAEERVTREFQFNGHTWVQRASLEDVVAVLEKIRNEIKAGKE